MARQPSRQDEPAGFEHGRFKVCDLCGALNHVEWPECFICSWHGHFATDPESVFRAAREQRESEQAEGLLPSPGACAADPLPAPRALLAYLRRMLRRLLHGR